MKPSLQCSSTGECMAGYFKLPRRKFGVVTLVIACTLAVFWLKSATLHDQLAWNSKAGRYYVQSCIGQLHLVSSSLVPDPTRVESRDFQRLKEWSQNEMKTPTWSYSSLPFARYSSYERDANGRLSYQPLKWSKVKWQHEFAGLHISESDTIDGHLAGTKTRNLRCIIPYWSIVIPLTLLSAWLLLSKSLENKIVRETV